ncbi:MAG TPA: hypothetical protein VF142_17185 [Longimicrobium sp.]
MDDPLPRMGWMVVAHLAAPGMVIGIVWFVAWAGLGPLAVAWLSTSPLQLPGHGRLAGGFGPAAHVSLPHLVRAAA